VFNITMKRIAIFFIPNLFLLASCQQQSQSVVESYLKAVKAGDMEMQQNLYCVVGGILSESQPIKSAPTWAIVGEEKRNTNTSPSYSYSLVTVKIDDSRHKFEVWKTDDIYNYEQTIFAEMKQRGVTLNNPVQDRKKWSPKSSCIVVDQE
jgi:hypothetical protein